MAEKIVYPKEFKYYAQEAYLKFKPNTRNCFVLSRYSTSSSASAIRGKSHQYVACHPFNDQGNYRFVAYVLPPSPEFLADMYAEYGIFVAYDPDEPENLIVVYGISFEHVKCQACKGTGYFKHTRKLTYAQIKNNVDSDSVLGKFNAGLTSSSTQCSYSPANRIGCPGTGVELEPLEHYSKKIGELMDCNKENIDLLISFAKEKIKILTKKRKNSE